MKKQDIDEFKRIEKVRLRLREVIKEDGTLRLMKGSRGAGKAGGRYEMCQWIDVELCRDNDTMASILFYEDARIDIRSGNLHPGRNGYVVFQKWKNCESRRPAPNIKIQVGNCSGVFIPFDKGHRQETGICVLGNDEDVIVDEIHTRFLQFLEQ